MYDILFVHVDLLSHHTRRRRRPFTNNCPRIVKQGAPLTDRWCALHINPSFSATAFILMIAFWIISIRNMRILCVRYSGHAEDTIVREKQCGAKRFYLEVNYQCTK